MSIGDKNWSANGIVDEVRKNTEFGREMLRSMLELRDATEVDTQTKDTEQS